VKARLAALAAVLALAAPALAAPPRVTARAVLVHNATTGEVLYRYHARDRVPVASITKLMTALVTLERARLDDVVVVAPEAVGIEGSSVGLRAGEPLQVRDLLKAILIQSANDAAWALAYHVGGGSVDRFVELMNRRARALGLADTHFVRPDGLDAPGHVSSARDATRLARVAMRRPPLREIIAMRTATIAGGRTLTTWNDLLGVVPGLFGVKTGHTSEAGWSQVAAVRARRVTVYATLLGGPTREQRNADLARLLLWGVSRYRVVAVVPRGRSYAEVPTEYGRSAIRLVPARPLVRSVRVGRPLVEQVVAPRSVSLPVAKGQPLGEVRVYERGRLVGRRALVADHTIERPGLPGRVSWYLGETAEAMWGWIT
jgi:D-alanyl-D-alanine carboxypeptidase (penicillin-binding protein 5/6)